MGFREMFGPLRGARADLPGEESMKIAIRMDDITPDMDWEKFLRFKAMLDERGIRPLLGIVPDHHDPKLSAGEPRADFWEYMCRLKDEEGYVLCMHGCHHVYTTDRGGMLPLNRQSEFAGVPYEEQLDLILKGKRILASHGIETQLFMAPAHSYDLNTLRALKAGGFTGLTDGFGARPYIYEDMIFYPISYRKSDSMKKTHGITTFVVHANTMNESDFASYRKILAEQDVVSYGEMLAADAERRGSFGHAKEYLMAAGKRALVARGGRG